MKTKAYLLIEKLTLILFAMSVNFVAFCQPPGGPPPGGQVPGGSGPPCWDPQCVPIDGGLGFLIVAGAVLGAKKIRDHRKQSGK